MHQTKCTTRCCLSWMVGWKFVIIYIFPQQHQLPAVLSEKGGCPLPLQAPQTTISALIWTIAQQSCPLPPPQWTPCPWVRGWGTAQYPGCLSARVQPRTPLVNVNPPATSLTGRRPHKSPGDATSAARKSLIWCRLEQPCWGLAHASSCSWRSVHSWDLLVCD